MNGTTILIWINIIIVAIIAIIVVKLHYRKQNDEIAGNLEQNDNIEIKDKLTSITSKITNSSSSLSKNESNSNLFNNANNNRPASLRKEGTQLEDFSTYIVPDVNENTNANAATIEYESPNQVMVNYESEVKKFQEPIKKSQMDIMTQRSNEKHELKDLFTIDELIKESKRKDDEREKESKKINKDKEDLTEIKESIKKRKENKNFEEELIEEVEDSETAKEESIADIINEDAISTESEDISSPQDMESVESESEDASKEESISDALYDSQESIGDEVTESEEIEPSTLESSTDSEESITDEVSETKDIKSPTLKSPKKINDEDGVSILSSDDNDYKLGGQSEDSELFDDMNDLDYRKDLAKVTNKIKKSKLLQDVREKLTHEIDRTPQEEDDFNENYIRNVTEYDEYEPIINETHMDFTEERSDDQLLREQNTEKVFKPKTVSDEKTKIAPIKSKPSRDNIKIQLNNNEVVLNKGDEIIFKYKEETYSSQVFAINGDDISVRYRRKNITIKPDDIKKIY